MSINYPRKAIPRSVAVFGAGGRMGRAVADYLRYAAPSVRLRLLTSAESKLEPLRAAIPDAEVMLADYLRPDSLAPALEGIEGVFVVTPSGLDETKAMNNFVDAARRAATCTHIVRVVGYEPESTLARVPAFMVERGGDGTQHYIAKAILEKSGLPVTFLNCGATLMDNLLFAAMGIRQARLLIWPEREVPYIDVRDFGEVAARVLLSDDARHITQFHTVNNGQDHPSTTDVVKIMNDAWRTPIRHDGSREAFLKTYGPFLKQRNGRDDEADYRWNFFLYENSNAVVWALNNFAERMLGRKPNTLRSWLLEHRELFFGVG
jgi:uncharacterized protein YbjT (DUF2867 family)